MQPVDNRLCMCTRCRSVLTSCSSGGIRRTRCSSSGTSDYICQTKDQDVDICLLSEWQCGGDCSSSSNDSISYHCTIPHPGSHIHPPGSLSASLLANWSLAHTGKEAARAQSSSLTSQSDTKQIEAFPSMHLWYHAYLISQYVFCFFFCFVVSLLTFCMAAQRMPLPWWWGTSTEPKNWTLNVSIHAGFRFIPKRQHTHTKMTFLQNKFVSQGNVGTVTLEM